MKRALAPTSLFVVAVIGLLMGGPSDALAQEAPPLFVETGEERKWDDRVKVRSRRGQIDFSMMEALLAGELTYLRLNLFEDVEVVVVQERIQQWNASEFTWRGRGIERPENSVTLEIDTSKKVLFGTLTVNDWAYRIEHLEGDLYVVYQIDTRFFPEPPRDWGIEEEDGTGESMERGEDSVRIGGTLGRAPAEEGGEREGLDEAAPQAAPPAGPVIDVLVLYTEQARDSTGGSTQMVQAIRNAFNNANTSFEGSGVNARFRMAAAASVQYNEASPDDLADMVADLKREGNTSGDLVNTLRNEYGADIVGLVVGDAKGACGRAADIRSSASTAYFVVGWGGCLGSNYSFAHEMGHVMGARHDWYVDDTNGEPFDYNHGFVNINNPNASVDAGWRTIMAYGDECGDLQSGDGPWCNRINRWSNPDSSWTEGGVTSAMGVASGDNAADNVRALNNTAASVAAFKSPMPVISGTVTDLLNGGGLEGVSVGGFYGPVTDANGYYERVIPKGDDVTIYPHKGEYTFDPFSRSYTNVTSDRTGQDYDANITYLIRGRVTDSSGDGVGGVEMDGAPPLSASTTTNQFGFYQLKAQKGWSGTVTPTSPGYDFSPSSATYTNISADQEQDYRAQVATYTVSGYVTESSTGNPISDVEMDGFYPNNPRTTLKTDASGFYSITLEHGWSGTITPRKTGYNFQPHSTTYGSLSQDRQTDYVGAQEALARSSWPLFGAGPQHHSAVQTRAVVRRVKWKNTLGGDATSAVVGSGGNVYVGAADGSVYAYDDGGSLLWKSKALQGDSITASPAAGAGQVVYAPSVLGGLTAYDQRGGIAWTYYADGPFYSSPLIGASGTIYIGSDDGLLYAIGAANGSYRWAFYTGGRVRSSPAAGSGGTIYVGSDDDSLYAVSSGGSLQWTYGTGGDVRSSPAVDTTSGTVYVGSDDGYLHAVDAASGTRQWRYQTGDAVRSSPAVDTTSGTVYVGSDDGYLHAVDAASGSRQWRYQIGSAVRSSPAVGRTRVRNLSPSWGGGRSYTYHTTVFVGASDGTLYSLDAAPSTTTRLQWAYATGGAISASPAIGAPEASNGISGGLFVGSDDGYLHALELQSEASATVSQLAQDLGQSLLEQAHIIVWENERGGPLGLIGKIPEGDPCEGGPLIIPDCDRYGRFGETSSPWRIAAGEELVFGLATGEHVDPIISGETTEGLLGTVTTTLEAGSASNLVLGGLTDPEAFAANPDGRSTELALFQKSGLAEAAEESSKQVSVYAGHFSTDAPALHVTLRNGEETFELGTLRYGEFSQTENVPPGRYEVIVETADEAYEAATASPTSTSSRSRMVDLTERAGEPVGLLASGFLHPEDNQGGPALALHVATAVGPSTGTQVTPGGPAAPEAFVLHGNAPNPFARTTTIRYALPQAATVHIEVFDALGRKVTELVDERKQAGRHEVRMSTENLSSGVYLYRMSAGSFTQTRRMVVVR